MSTNHPAGTFDLSLELQSGYAFEITFDKDHYPRLRADEPAPLGEDSGPNPARLLAAAVADCLAASLLFCLQKRGQRPTGLGAKVIVEMVRNEARRLRIGHIDVVLRPTLDGASDGLTACLDQFEDFCVVTQSVRQGLDVRVKVEAA
ncbi:MAG: OsmC family protein [Deltaproteobacteria bacterium]|nr:OsmC family protein [Deltaproteobacteria bacterium]